MSDAWRESSDRRRCVSTYTSAHLMSVCVSHRFTLNISKGQERKQRENGYQNLEQQSHKRHRRSPLFPVTTEIKIV